MSFENSQGSSPLPFVAGGTIAQYRAVLLDSTEGQVVAAAAIATGAFGVSLNSGVATDQMRIATDGVRMLTASAAIAAGAEVMVTAAGAGKVSTAAGATAKSIGVAMKAAAADGDVIPVKLQLSGKGPANT